MLAQPEKAAAAKSSRKPSSLVSGRHYHVSTCYPASGGSVSPPPRLGVGGGVEPNRESQSSGPSEPRVGLDCHLFLLSLILPLTHLRRRLCVSACVHLDMFFISLSLSLSLTSTSRCLLYLFIFSVRISSGVSAKKQRPVQR
jgi:hypothetical protein